VYAIYLTLLLGFPHSVWRNRHLAHHGSRHPAMPLNAAIAVESGLVICLWVLLFKRAPEFFVATYAPGCVLGLMLCYLHGLFEHAGGTWSHYSALYNAAFFNDGYHVEHHAAPRLHWTRLPQCARAGARGTSRFPAVLRWLEVLNLELLERIVLKAPALQRFMLKTHGRALRRLLPKLPPVRSVLIVGGGMFPRSAMLLEKLMPAAEITVIDANAGHLEVAKSFFHGNARMAQAFFDASQGCGFGTDLLVIPLAFAGARKSLYANPPAPAVLIHDWIWARRGEGVVVSPWLLKRLNLIIRR
jgi:hypothetical protein